MASSYLEYEADFVKAKEGTVCDMCGAKVDWEATYEGFGGTCNCLNMSWFMEPLEVMVYRENMD